MSFISVDNITAGYTKEKVLEEVSFKIDEGELIGILGLNGSGKSTLAKAICNIIPHEGNVTINKNVVEDLKISQVAKLISYVSQKSGLSLDISVLDVVLMGFNPTLKLLEKPNQRMIDEAKFILETIGLYDYIDTNFMLLSEGQKQLTILARALISSGSLLVMDEPDSSLDFNVRIKMFHMLRNWIKNESRAGLVILHDVMLALNNCDRLILLNNKTIEDVVDLHNDKLEDIEEKLRKVYKDISLFKIKNKFGKENFTVLFESEA